MDTRKQPQANPALHTHPDGYVPAADEADGNEDPALPVVGGAASPAQRGAPVPPPAAVPAPGATDQDAGGGAGHGPEASAR